MQQFKTIKKLQNFLIWAQKQGLNKVKIGEMEFTFAPAHHTMEGLSLAPDGGTSGTLSPEELKKQLEKEENELLYWSAR